MWLKIRTAYIAMQVVIISHYIEWFVVLEQTPLYVDFLQQLATYELLKESVFTFGFYFIV